jgi:hypothetical protein
LESANLVPSATSNTQSIVVTVIETALQRCDYYPMRSSCAYLFECYLHNNPNGQLAIASTFKAPPHLHQGEANSWPSPGSLIISAVADWTPSRKDPLRSFFACFFLSLVLVGNGQSKRLALDHKINLDVYGETVTNSLLFVAFAQLMTASREASGPSSSNGSVAPISTILVSYLQLLVVWTEGSVEAVHAIFQHSSHLNFVIEQIVKSSSVLVQVQGLSALLLGFLYEYNDDSLPSFSKQVYNERD